MQNEMHLKRNDKLYLYDGFMRKTHTQSRRQNCMRKATKCETFSAKILWKSNVCVWVHMLLMCVYVTLCENNKNHTFRWKKNSANKIKIYCACKGGEGKKLWILHISSFAEEKCRHFQKMDIKKILWKSIKVLLIFYICPQTFEIFSSDYFFVFLLFHITSRIEQFYKLFFLLISSLTKKN